MIYIDVFFIINFIMDYIILSIGDIKKITKRKRRLISSFFSALFSCFMIIYPIPFYFSSVFKILFLLIMTAIAVLPTSIKKYISYSLSVFVSSVFLLTGVFTVDFFKNSNDSFLFFHTPSEILLSFEIAIGYLLFKYIKSAYKASKDKKFYQLEIYYNDKSAKIKALKDTGNLLKTPFSATPVIVCDKSVFEKLFVKNIEPEELREFVDIKDFKVIMYKTISETGVIYGFRPQNLKIDGSITNDIIIGFAPVKLESEALINPMILN